MQVQGVVSEYHLRLKKLEVTKSAELGRHKMSSPKMYTSCQKNSSNCSKRKAGGAQKLFRKRRSLQSTNGFLLDDGGTEIAVQCGIHSNIASKNANGAGSSCSWPFPSEDAVADSSCSDSSPSPAEDRVIFQLNSDACCLYCPPVVLADSHVKSRSTNSVHWKAQAHGDDDAITPISLEYDGEVAQCSKEEIYEFSSTENGGNGKSACIVRYKPIYEGDILVCRSAPFSSALGKLFWIRVFKRWESCRIRFYQDRFTCQSNATARPTEHSTRYSDIRHIQILPRKENSKDCIEPGHVSRPCIRVTLADHQILLQAKNSHICCQWFYTLHWRNRLAHGRLLLLKAETLQQVRAELTSLVEYVILCRISHEEVKVSVLDVLSDSLCSENRENLQQLPIIEMVNILQPLLLCVQNYVLSDALCQHLSIFFVQYPNSPYLLDVFAPLVQCLLKHSNDFGKRPQVRDFIADFFLALMNYFDFEQQVDSFVATAHGSNENCPHIRVLSNLVAVSLASLQLCRSHDNLFYNGIKIAKPVDKNYFEDRYPSDAGQLDENVSLRRHGSEQVLSESADFDNGLFNENNETGLQNSSSHCRDVSSESDKRTIRCFLFLLKSICRFQDWRYSLAPLLQPIPFAKNVLVCDSFILGIESIIESFAGDERCEVHTCVLGVRDGKLGWFHLFAPGGLLATESQNGSLFCHMLSALINCCYRRKKFILYLSAYFLSPILLLASKGNVEMMDLLCMMLQMEILDTAETRVEVISTLESSKEGHDRYCRTCDEISKLKELQSKGGPTMLSLPPKSSDYHLMQVLQSGGYFGNLESLSLAFTNITSNSGELIAKLRGLKYLNLWATNFGDTGLQVISDSLVNLQVLNLCETPVTDRGIVSLVHIKSLRRLNLNSTKLSPHTFETLKKRLPLLQEVDVRYTDAW